MFFAESVPILVVPGGYARRIAHIAPNYHAVTQMRGVTKSARTRALERSTMRRALALPSS